jgi:hypothetical protein
VKHIYSTGIIDDCHLRSSKYFYNTGHWWQHGCKICFENFSHLNNNKSTTTDASEENNIFENP